MPKTIRETLVDTWGRALDATSDDFRNTDSSIREKAYMEYRAKALDTALTDIAAILEGALPSKKKREYKPFPTASKLSNVGVPYYEDRGYDGAIDDVRSRLKKVLGK